MMATTVTDYCKHELVLTECTHCRPKPKIPYQESVTWGPWFFARLPGSDCAECGETIKVGQQVRSNGRRGQYLCTTCGQA
jgi:hypothetical protein